MTATDGLVRLLEQATPGPWVVWEDDLYWKVDSEAAGCVCNTGRTSWDRTRDDARLIALAPDMARLLIDMADTLRPLAGRPDPLTDKINVLLARFADLEGNAT